MLLQAKDSDDDDEVTVSVDRDRFMDEFFEQVRALFLQCGFEAASDLSAGTRVGCGCSRLTVATGDEDEGPALAGAAQLMLRVVLSAEHQEPEAVLPCGCFPAPPEPRP